jgi:hypothetical protein
MKILLRIAVVLYAAAVLWFLSLVNVPRELVCVSSGDGVMLCRTFIATSHAYITPHVIERAVPRPNSEDAAPRSDDSVRL